jgi:NAD(P) transhydrogenase subunit alpha
VVKIGIPKEIAAGETRVALIPANVKDFLKLNHEVLVEQEAGLKASFADEEYRRAGAVIVQDTKKLYGDSDVILKVQPPRLHPGLNRHEAELIKREGTFIGFLSLFQERDYLETFKANHITSFAMEFVPRITRAQGMDALSSMATIAGYKAVLMAADLLPRLFPMMMTAAGTIPPATVMVLGAGVAGLQAIATARRLGAKVEAFDPRPAVKEQVQSLGAQFIEMAQAVDAETGGGYAREQSQDFLIREQETIGARLPKTDVVITTAQIFGKASPILITAEMVKRLKPGSVIIDIAAEQGGNCELTEAGKEIKKHGVTIVGAVNLPAALPVHASQMYAKNVTNLFRHLFGGEGGQPDFDDEIVKGTCITHRGELVNAFLRERLKLNDGGE